MWSKGIEMTIFSKKYWKWRSGWGLRPQIPDCDTVELHYFTQTVFQCRRFRFSTFGLSPVPLPNSWFSAKPGHGFWCFILRYLCSHKKFLFWKILITSLHVICGLLPPPPNQKPWQRLWPSWWQIKDIILYNKGTEVVSKCCHRNYHKLGN